MRLYIYTWNEFSGAVWKVRRNVFKRNVSQIGNIFVLQKTILVYAVTCVVELFVCRHEVLYEA